MKTEEEILKEYYDTRINIDGCLYSKFEDLDKGIIKSIKNSVGFNFFILDVRMQEFGRSVEENIKKDIVKIKMLING